MKTTHALIALALPCMALTAAPATAQGRGDAVLSQRTEAVAGRRSVLGYDRAGERMHTPWGGAAFCRDRSGHPVYGRRWCADRGQAARGNAGAARFRWDRVRWGRVRLPAPRGSGRIEWLPASAILDRVVVRRLQRHATRLGLRGSLAVRLVRDRRGVLSAEIRSGPLVFAELVDRNRDGWADLILVARA